MASRKRKNNNRSKFVAVFLAATIGIGGAKFVSNNTINANPVDYESSLSSISQTYDEDIESVEDLLDYSEALHDLNLTHSDLEYVDERISEYREVTLNYSELDSEIEEYKDLDGKFFKSGEDEDRLEELNQDLGLAENVVNLQLVEYGYDTMIDNSLLIEKSRLIDASDKLDVDDYGSMEIHYSSESSGEEFVSVTVDGDYVLSYESDDLIRSTAKLQQYSHKKGVSNKDKCSYNKDRNTALRHNISEIDEVLDYSYMLQDHFFREDSLEKDQRVNRI